MKKFLSMLLVSTICMSLTACGNSESESKETTKEEKATELSIGTNNSVEDYVDFTLIKVETTNEIAAPMGNGFYYENSTDGNTYVDVILDVTNTSAEEIDSSDLLDIEAKNLEGVEHRKALYAVETNGGTDVSTNEMIAPLGSARIHCAVSVPESETELQLTLKVKDQKYTYDYVLGKTISNATVLAAGETIGTEDFAKLVLKDVTYTENLLPKNTSSFYTHYEVDDPSNIYLVANFDITNYQSSAKEIETFVGVTAKYMDKYEYTGFVIVEDLDQTGFSSYESIAPLTTRNLYYLIEVPKSVIENEAELTIVFNGQEYIYKHASK